MLKRLRLKKYNAIICDITMLACQNSVEQCRFKIIFYCKKFPNKNKRNVNDEFIVVKLQIISLSTSYFEFRSRHLLVTLHRDQRSQNSNNFEDVDLSFYEDLIHRHTVRKDKETKDSKDHGKKSKNH